MQKLLSLLSKSLPTIPVSATYTIAIGDFNDSLCLKIGIGPSGATNEFAAIWNNQYFTVGIPYEIVPALVDYLEEGYPADTYNIINIQDGTTIESISGEKAFEVVDKIITEAKDSIQRFLDIYVLLQ